jgi:hypothetical protein
MNLQPTTLTADIIRLTASAVHRPLGGARAVSSDGTWRNDKPWSRSSGNGLYVGCKGVRTLYGRYLLSAFRRLCQRIRNAALANRHTIGLML